MLYVTLLGNPTLSSSVSDQCPRGRNGADVGWCLYDINTLPWRWMLIFVRVRERETWCVCVFNKCVMHVSFFSLTHVLPSLSHRFMSPMRPRPPPPRPCGSPLLYLQCTFIPVVPPCHFQFIYFMCVLILGVKPTKCCSLLNIASCYFAAQCWEL